jgi:hypothetical protein
MDCSSPCQNVCDIGKFSGDFEAIFTGFGDVFDVVEQSRHLLETGCSATEK